MARPRAGTVKGVIQLRGPAWAQRAPRAAPQPTHKAARGAAAGAATRAAQRPQSQVTAKEPQGALQRGPGFAGAACKALHTPQTSLHAGLRPPAWVPGTAPCRACLLAAVSAKPQTGQVR